MTNSALVRKLLDNGMAEVTVTRQSACGGNCASCGGCSNNNVMTAVARNLINARPGQRVIIESSTKKVFSAVALVYVMPLLLFLLSYAAAYSFGCGEGVCVLVSFAALVLSGALLVLYQRLRGKKAEIVFNIVSLEEDA